MAMLSFTTYELTYCGAGVTPTAEPRMRTFMIWFARSEPLDATRLHEVVTFVSRALTQSVNYFDSLGASIAYCAELLDPRRLDEGIRP